MNILKALFGTKEYVSRTDTVADSPDPDPNDTWALTDPDARDDYFRRGKKSELEHDIRFEVMRGGPWQPEELGYKCEIRRLLREGVIEDKGSYWYRSPFSTVYRAKKSGSLTIASVTHEFRKGDDIVFQCRMTRDTDPKLKGPVLIARLTPTDQSQLCGDMGGAMKGMGKM